ncbi:PTR3 SPS-sensor component PTR3 [Candida maltosa Xu316]
MDKLSSLENLLRFPGYTNGLVFDASVLSCGCLTSEYIFKEQNTTQACPNCHAENVTILSPIKPLRELYSIIQSMYTHQERRRRSSSRKSIGESQAIQQQTGGQSNTESTDLISLFYKFAKEEQFERDNEINIPQPTQVQLETNHTKVEPIEISRKSTQNEIPLSYPSSMSLNSMSISPQNHRYLLEKSITGQQDSEFAGTNNELPENFDHNLLQSVSEQKEYNFTKKLSTFPTQQLKLNFSSIVPFKSTGGNIKKATSTSIHSYHDFKLGVEITRFVLMNEKKWELYEYVVPMGDVDNNSIKPQLLCCGRSTGEYGDNLNNLSFPESNIKEIVIKNEFGVKDNNNPNTNTNNSNNDSDIRRRLSSWDQMYCRLTKNYLIISGTKGIMRVFNVNKLSPYDFGQPIYTYITNYPIRCIAISPNDSLIACGITAKERISGKEQPFIILHRLVVSEDFYLDSVDPITITIPYRDPIKLINFNATSTHLIIATSWESRYLIIKLTNSYKSDNYRKPRLIWSDVAYRPNRRIDESSSTSAIYDEKADAEHELMMSKEGITDLEFGMINSNVVIVTSCSFRNRPPMLVRLYGAHIDSVPKNPSNSHEIRSSNSLEEDEEFSSISSAEVFMKITEIGSMIHKVAISPRGDGIVFLDKDGRLFLVSAPTFHAGGSINASDTKNKKRVVQLGEVANAERFSESASVVFSADGGKVFTLDRKGVFSVFDFTKGIPGDDPEVVKCKIISL